LAAAGGAPAITRGAREARSAAKRGQEPDRGLASGRDLRIPGLRLSARPLVTGRLEGASNAEAHTADGVADKAQGSVPSVSVTTGGAADRGDQPDPAGVGELLPDREREPVPGLCEAVGRAESAAPFNEGEGPSRLRLEEGEDGVGPGAARAVRRLLGPIWGCARKRSWSIGHITHGAKQTGERRTGNPSAPFEAAGAGAGPLQAPRQSSTLRVARARRTRRDPLRRALGVLPRERVLRLTGGRRRGGSRLVVVT